MPNSKNIKSAIISKLHDLLDIRMLTYQSAIDSAIESKLNETKSSAGDKFETGRAMMQHEQEKNEMLLSKSNKEKDFLTSIESLPSSEFVKNGSLVATNSGIYFIGLGIGKILLDNQHYFVVSLESPIGQLLHNRKVGDKVTFQSKTIEVTQIT